MNRRRIDLLIRIKWAIHIDSCIKAHIHTNHRALLTFFFPHSFCSPTSCDVSTCICAAAFFARDYTFVTFRSFLWFCQYQWSFSFTSCVTAFHIHKSVFLFGMEAIQFFTKEHHSICNVYAYVYVNRMVSAVESVVLHIRVCRHCHVLRCLCIAAHVYVHILDDCCYWTT